MNTIGYNVIAQNGWIVKKYADGKIKRLTPIQTVKRSGTIRLD
jgi:hypothetical protein